MIYRTDNRIRKVDRTIADPASADTFPRWAETTSQPFRLIGCASKLGAC